MAIPAMCARIFSVLAVVAMVNSLTMDREATEELIAAASSARDRGEVAILVRGPHGKSARREELLHAKSEDDVSISLYYNRKTNKVSLESLHGGHLKSVSWGLKDHEKGTLLLVASSNGVRLYAGCVPLHWHSMSGTYDLLDILRDQKTKLYHEENAPVEIYGSEKAAVESLSCAKNNIRPPTLLRLDEPESDVEEVQEFRKKEALMDREEEMQGDDATNYLEANGILPQPSRGDIPQSAIESCDDEVIRQLTLLRQIIEHLRREVGDQKHTIDSLRSQLHQCCNRVPVTPPPVERCSGSSCYPGY